MRNVSVLFVALLIGTAAAAQDRLEALPVRDGERTVSLTLAELDKLPRQVAEAVENGDTVRYEGPRLVDVLGAAGVTFGQTMRGARLASYLLVGAEDGFRAIVALPEIDPDFAEHEILLADRRNDSPLSARDGPFRLVIPGDKRHARWVRQVSSLTILAAPEGP